MATAMEMDMAKEGPPPGSGRRSPYAAQKISRRRRRRGEAAIVSPMPGLSAPEIGGAASRGGRGEGGKSMKPPRFDVDKGGWAEEAQSSSGGGEESPPPPHPPPPLRPLTKDYLGLAQTYGAERPYRASSDGIGDGVCLACGVHYGSGSGAAPPTAVLFPCEHRCICNGCLEQKGMGPGRVQPSGMKCPLCREDVRLVVRGDGDSDGDGYGKGNIGGVMAREKYWRWVEEVRPNISAQFVQDFSERSRQAIALRLSKRTASRQRIFPGKLATNDEGSNVHELEEHVVKKDMKKRAGSKVCVIS